MFGLYLLISIATHFTTGLSFNGAPIENATLSTTFSSLNGLRVGSPVTIQGELVGNVTTIKETHSKTEQEKSPVKGNAITKFEVQFSLTRQNQLVIGSEVIALIANPIVPDGVKEQSVIEILLPNSKSLNLPSQSTKVRGFSSYKEFWSASDIKI